MRLLSIASYIDFKCVGADCEISCCGGGWSIPIDNETMDYYLSVDGEFGERLRKGIERINETNVFKLNDSSKDCVFLNENGLCNIYRNLGPDALCETCKSYPRGMYEVGDIVFCFLDNSCPEANRIVMQKKEPVKTLFDDSDPEDVHDIDWNRFNSALKALHTGINIIQNREISLRNRLLLVSLFVARFQELMKEQKEARDLLRIFSDPLIYSGFLNNSMFSVKDYRSKIWIHSVVHCLILDVIQGHQRMKSYEKQIWDVDGNQIEESDRLKEAFESIESNTDLQIEMEQIMVHRYFVFFMQGFKENDYLKRMVYEYSLYSALITFMALYQVETGGELSQKDRILYYSLCCRIEHNKVKKKELEEKIKKGGFEKEENLIRLIS